MKKIKYYAIVIAVAITLIIVYVAFGKDQASRYAKQAEHWRKKTLAASAKDFSSSMTEVDSNIIIRNDRLDEDLKEIEGNIEKQNQKINNSSIRDIAKEFKKYNL